MSDVFNGDGNTGNPVFVQFDADISGWDVSNVQTFFRMFRKAEIFEADISGWNVSNADNFGQMFRSSELFNADLSSWDLSSATSFNAMFRGARVFDQDLSMWAVYFVPGVGNFKDMFRGSGISQNLCSWDSTFPYGVNVDNMFLGANNCQNQTSPVEEVGGPFCANCGEDPETSSPSKFPSLSPVTSSPITSDPTVSPGESPVTSSPSKKPTMVPTAPMVGLTSAPTFVSMIYLIS